MIIQQVSNDMSIIANENAVYAERATVTFCDGLSLDGYQLPNGEFRVGVTGASKALGYNRDWLGKVIRRGGDKFKALQEQGFEPNFQKVVVKSGRPPETMSLDDFNSFILIAIQDGKKPALALLKGLTALSLNDFFRDAFGLSELSIAEKRKIFYQTYAAALTPEDWRQMDREDNEGLILGCGGFSVFG
jgi:hypothetical protein